MAFASKAFRVACLTAALLLLPIIPAKACSCMGDYDPRDVLADSEGAIIGTYLEKVSTDPTDSFSDAIYRFRVDEEVKGEYGETLDVYAANNGASCGLEIPLGEQAGLFLYKGENGEWRSSLCSQIAPERLREAAAPLPDPDGELPVKHLVGGSFGDKRVMSLDAQGRTIAYGDGDGDVVQLGLCPGSERSVEIVFGYEQAALLAVRELDTLEVVREVSLPIGSESAHVRQYPMGLRCLSEDASEVVLFSSFDGGGYSASKHVLWRVTGDDVTKIHSGGGVLAAFGDGRVYVADGLPDRDVFAISLETGRARKVGTAPRAQIMGLGLDSSGRRLAGVSFPKSGEGEKLAKVWTMSVRDGSIRSKTLNEFTYYSDVQWTDDDDRVVLVALYGRSLTFDRSLQPAGKLRFVAQDSQLVGDDLFGVFYGTLRLTSVTEGGSGPLSDLPSPITRALATVR